jgi:predicted RND superfamily exporter protein
MSNDSRLSADRLAVGLAGLVLRFRWLVVLVCLGLIAAIGAEARHLIVSNNYRIFFSDSNPELLALERFEKTFTGNDNILIFVTRHDGGDVFEPDTMGAVAEMTEAAWQIPYTTRVDSVANFQYTYADGDELIVEDLLAEPESLDAEGFTEKRRIALSEPVLAGQLVSRDGKAAAINVVVNHPDDDQEAVDETAAAARALRDEIDARYPALDIRLTGVTMLDVAFTESSVADYTTLVPAMLGLVLVLTLLTLRSASLALVVMLMVLLSVVATLGAGGMMRVAITPISLSAAVVVMTLAVADSIHILLTMRHRMRGGAAKREALIEAIRVNFLAVGITSLSTAVGFLALNTSDAPPFWHLGNMAAAGIAAAWVLSITLMPALVSFLPIKAAGAGASRSAFTSRIAGLLVARRRAFAIFSTAAAGVLILQIGQLEFNDQWTKYFGKEIPFRTDTDLATRYFGLYPIEFTVPASEPGGIADPAYLARLDAFASWLEGQEGVLHVYSVSDIMKRLNKNLNADDPDFYRLPEDRELSAQYLLLYELSLPYGLDLGDRISIDKSASRLTATLGNVTTAQTKAFLADAERYTQENFPPGLRPQPTSTHVMFTYITDRNLEQMFGGTLIAVAAICAIMVVSLRSVKLGLLSLVPNALPIAVAFGAWALLVGEIGFSIAVVAAISLGIVVDDTVHLLSKYMRGRRERDLSAEEAVRYAIEEVGPAILFNTVILTAGFGLLALSSFKLTADMGLLTALSIMLALVLDFLLLPALLIAADKKAPGPRMQSSAPAGHLAAAEPVLETRPVLKRRARGGSRAVGERIVP